MKGGLNFSFLWEVMPLKTVLHILTFIEYTEKKKPKPCLNINTEQINLKV